MPLTRGCSGSTRPCAAKIAAVFSAGLFLVTTPSSRAGVPYTFSYSEHGRGVAVVLHDLTLAGRFCARVDSAATSDPAPGSVMPSAPIFSPAIAGTR